MRYNGRMFRFVFIFSTLLMFAFALMLGTIRSRAYIPVADIQLNITANCPLPCWRGIRPGSTHVETALIYLERMDDVTDITDTPTSSSLQGEVLFINWRWIGGDPDTSGLLIVEDSIVQEIFMPMQLQLGDIWLSFGLPNGGEVAFADGIGMPFSISHMVFYYERGLTVMNYVYCPIIAPRLWTQPVVIHLRDLDETRISSWNYDRYLPHRMEMLILGNRQIFTRNDEPKPCPLEWR